MASNLTAAVTALADIYKEFGMSPGTWEALWQVTCCYPPYYRGAYCSQY